MQWITRIWRHFVCCTLHTGYIVFEYGTTLNAARSIEKACSNTHTHTCTGGNDYGITLTDEPFLQFRSVHWLNRHSRKTWAISIYWVSGLNFFKMIDLKHQRSYGYVIQHIVNYRKSHMIDQYIQNFFSLRPVVCQNPHFLRVWHKLSSL